MRSATVTLGADGTNTVSPTEASGALTIDVPAGTDSGNALAAVPLTWGFRCSEISVKNDSDQVVSLKFFIGGSENGKSPDIPVGGYWSESWNFDLVQISTGAVTNGDIWIRGRA